MAVMTREHAGPHLIEIARVYNTTATMGYRALDEVAARFRLTPSAAANRVKEAHLKGLIPRLQRRPHRKILAVAEALDVTPIELAHAITDIAGGTLTITNHSLTGGTP